MDKKKLLTLAKLRERFMEICEVRDPELAAIPSKEKMFQLICENRDMLRTLAEKRLAEIDAEIEAL